MVRWLVGSLATSSASSLRATAWSRWPRIVRLFAEYANAFVSTPRYPLLLRARMLSARSRCSRDEANAPRENEIRPMFRYPSDFQRGFTALESQVQQLLGVVPRHSVLGARNMMSS